MTPEVVPAIRKSMVVNAAAERAFRLFVERFDVIKPREHNLLAAPIVETVFEPFVGGCIYDIAADGSRCKWSRVLVYEPPSRIVLSWDIGSTWQIESDLERTSEVEVSFIAEGAERTRVELEHRHLERHGPDWKSMADRVAGDAGWSRYLDRYRDIVDQEMKL